MRYPVIRATLSALKRSARRFVSRIGMLRKANCVPVRWHRRPNLNPAVPVCIFVMLPREGVLLPHSVDHARAWHECGYQTVCVVIQDSLDRPVNLSGLEFASGILGRVNRGYDFGAWAGALARLGREVGNLPRLVLANDSVIGPSDRFAEMVDRIGRSSSDVIALVQSQELQNHFQSFVMAFNPLSLKSSAFRWFWSSIRSGDRAYVIRRYELKLADRMIRAGLTVETLFVVAAEQVTNPTLSRWRELVEAGFPYVKVELLRSNPLQSDLGEWRAFCEARGFRRDLLDRQVGSLMRSSSAAWAIEF